MRQKDFLVWMLGFPITSSITELISEYFLGKVYSDQVYVANSFIMISFHCGIGYLLWNKKR